MHFSTLCLISFTLLLHTVFADDPYHICSSSNINYTANGPNEKNLNILLASLSLKVPPSGFGLDSVDRYHKRVNGLALCRGDISSRGCKDCVVDASSQIRSRCPLKEEAIIWYDICLLKYSNEDFFGKIDNKNKIYLSNAEFVIDPITFNQKTNELLNHLSLEAYSSPVSYATGQLELRGSRMLYGLVQCTRDLSSKDCKKCLDDAISELPSYCDGKKGGRFTSGSCNFRYELYPFVTA